MRAPAELRALFAEFADFARQHRDLIRRFGRFPHRNALLGRASNPGERDFLASGGAAFGASPRSSG